MSNTINNTLWGNWNWGTNETTYVGDPYWESSTTLTNLTNLNGLNSLANMYFRPSGESILNIKYLSNPDGSMTVSLDIPGVKQEDITIEVAEKMITVKGERKTDQTSLSIMKSFSIPTGFSADNAVAELQDGVLAIKFTEKLVSETRNIPILSPINRV